MKKRISLQTGFFLLLCFLLVRCSEDDQASQETIQYSFSVAQPELTGGRTGTLDDVRSAIVTLKDAAGAVIFEKKIIKVYQYGSAFVSESIPLKPARYFVCEFMLTDGNSDVLYASPVKSSVMSKTVTQPLPVQFVVSKNVVKNVSIQVTSTAGKGAADFGYASFSVTPALMLQVSALLAENSSVSVTDANFAIYKGTEMIFSKNLEAKVNNLAFPGHEDELYTMIFTKTGYGQYTRTFVYNDLITELNGKPLNITFRPALIITVVPDYYENYSFSLKVLSFQNLMVDWGDGTREEIKGEIAHTYATVDSHLYTVTITGDLSSIWAIQSGDYKGEIYSYDTKKLANLRVFSHTTYDGLDNIDLSANTKLEYVALDYGYDLPRVILPASHNIKNFTMDYTQVSDTALLAIVQNLYANASVNSTTHGGYFSAQPGGWTIPPSVNEVLSGLKNEFGWTVSPDVE